MTAFDHFQHATVLIASGDKAKAAAVLTKAIAKIDRNGVDADMRADLCQLRAMVS